MSDTRTEPLAGNVQQLSAVGVLSARRADVGAARETCRRRRLWRLATVAGVPAAYLWLRLLTGNPVGWGLPHIDPMTFMVALFFGGMLLLMIGQQYVTSRSPHVAYRPEQISITLDDVKGLGPVKEDVIRSLNLFLAHKTFRQEMGGSPRRGLLFEGAPGTGKTYMAKAMAREAGVPFLFVSATSFQSMWYGGTAKKIRGYFKALRKAARAEGGAIGFIEEIDAIATRRQGMGATEMGADLRAVGLTAGGLVRSRMVSEGTGGVVNELLVQMQSFDDPTGWQKLLGRLSDAVNLLLPAGRQLPKPKVPPTNVLLIAATNRADNLDPALLRPGRFDRRMSFPSPAKESRRELVDYFLAKKAHAPELDTEDKRDTLAAVTQGYTPVMIEHLFDEALVNAVRRGSVTMNWADVEHARLVEEVGLGHPVEYTAHETALIATHEAGHATAAHLVAPNRRLEILTIVKRNEALGLLAHGDKEDVYTRSRSEMLALIQIALAGQVAEELFFGDVSTGPSGDLAYATNVACQMVGAAGMCGSLISVAAVQGNAFSDTNLVGRVLGDSAMREMVEDLLAEQKLLVKAKLDENRHLIEALRDALLDRHELIGREITDVLAEAAEASTAGRLALTGTAASSAVVG